MGKNDKGRKISTLMQWGAGKFRGPRNDPRPLSYRTQAFPNLDM